MSQDRTRLVAGCMTGTSLDGLDVALVKITATGLEMKAELLGHHALPLSDDLRSTLMSLASGEANEPIVYMRAARALGELHADGLEQLIASCPLSLEGEGRGEGEAQSTQSTNDKHNALKLDFVTAHGQTIWHAPRDPRKADSSTTDPKSWQLFDPWPIVKRLSVPVCYDLRQADLIAGGEGAPLTPIADWVMYRNSSDFVINLGGVMNYTRLFESVHETVGGDVSPCNLLLDGLCQKLFNHRFDSHGVLAGNGRLDHDVRLAIYKATEGVKQNGSLGREQYSHQWVEKIVSYLSNQADPHDVLFTACEYVASACKTVTSPRWDSRPRRMVVAGGGAKNAELIRQIKVLTDGPVMLSDDLGIPCEAREAMGFAVLGALSQDGVPISLPQVTGATNPGVAGVWAGV
ncbi:MAG: anhydro-N-acetylmuramic acid kinase [Planctomycetota bacterium]